MVTAGAVSAAAVPSAESYAINALHAKPTRSVALDARLVEGEVSENLNSATLRSFGTFDGVKYWIALDNDGLLCLVALIDTKDWVAGMSCAGPEAFAAQGTGVRLLGPRAEVEAYLIPDGEVARAGFLTSKTPNLVVANPAASARDREVVAPAGTSRTTSEFQLRVFAGPISRD
ncbi:hypothetical protein [Microbacterium flavescens]|uniref:hypothetical protein n=1 Tax=Microbacterium flavescens TaxID=69366 RepID=UPI001BDE5E7A|nr:hypothetical protein [Microbacterium flavescens]BFF09691.1 hypothetical protein GCM10025699_09940 [Microbacterium flavescens]